MNTHKNKYIERGRIPKKLIVKKQRENEYQKRKIMVENKKGINMTVLYKINLED